ncbi:hypothetical protein ACTXT7_004339 [Hymenolepis weldensis]
MESHNRVPFLEPTLCLRKVIKKDLKEISYPNTLLGCLKYNQTSLLLKIHLRAKIFCTVLKRMELIFILSFLN